MGAPPTINRIEWTWWTALWDAVLILVIAGLLAVVLSIPLAPALYLYLSGYVYPREYPALYHILVLPLWDTLQVWLLFKWVWSRPKAQYILPLLPIKCSLGTAASGVFLTFVFSIAAIYIGTYYSTSPRSEQFEFFSYAMHSAIAPLMLFGGVVTAPLAEELVFRGFLHSTLSASRLGFWGSAIVVSILWSLIHMYGWHESAAIVFTGITLSMLRRATGSLIPGMIVHGAINLVLFLMFAQA
jgi:membrane protease YdiL (CAAX protease family)